MRAVVWRVSREVVARPRVHVAHQASRTLCTSPGGKVVAPPMVYIKGEEMTAYTMSLIMDKWVKPHVDVGQWEFFDLSCKARDDSNDQVLRDAVEAGNRIGAIFKEPTVTPTDAQKTKLGLKKAWGSPNGAMRRGWNGITISRDTIHIDGVSLGYKRPVLFERHAVGGEYGAGWSTVGRGRLMTTFFPDDEGAPPVIVDARSLSDASSVAVVYHNPLDNVEDLAHHFFARCLKAKVVPYVVTKKTVFKWQEGFWAIMKRVFDEHYKEDFKRKGLLVQCGGDLQHLISDAATMQIIRWTDGGFGMAAHNYDGDMLTDEMSQVHRSPGFITSALVGKREDGTIIKEFEASHGTVADMWEDHLAGRETSMNPLGMATALIGAMRHSVDLVGGCPDMARFCTSLHKALHSTFRYDKGTRDLSGPTGFTTEQFVGRVARRLANYMNRRHEELLEAVPKDVLAEMESNNVDKDALLDMFVNYDTDRSGAIDLDEFVSLLVRLGVAPKRH